MSEDGFKVRGSINPEDRDKLPPIRWEEVQEAHSGLVGWAMAEEEPIAVYKMVASYLTSIEFSEDLHIEPWPYINPTVGILIDFVRQAYSGEYKELGLDRTCSKFHESD